MEKAGSKRRQIRGLRLSVLAAALLVAFLATPPTDYFHPRAAQAGARAGGATPETTHIAIEDTVLQPAVERVGMNLGEQTYFDSGMLLKNLVARNPGFEGGIFQSIVRCKQASAEQCVDDDADSIWPKDFWGGAAYEWITGPLEGRKGQVTGSAAAGHGSGAVLELADAAGAAKPAARQSASGAAYLVARKAMPGDAAAGWWTETEGGATLGTEFKDLSPHTAGRQALRMDAEGVGARAAVLAYFDSLDGHTFVRLTGRYRLSFRAKAVAGGPGAGNALRVALERLSRPSASFLGQDVALGPEWQDYNLDFEAKDAPATATGAVRLTFSAANETVLLDDVSLQRVDGDPANTTAFRDEVVEALRAYRPGVLRFMQFSTGLGNTVDNLLAAPGARARAGYSAWQTEQTDQGYGLPEFLELCAAVRADPWIVVPAGSSARDMRRLVEYLTASDGKNAAWSAKFNRIHLEIGNETWNTLYCGASIEYPEDYGHRATALFRAARGAAGYDAKRFDLLIGGQAGWPERSAEMLKFTDAADSLSVAPYLVHDIPATASTDDVFGALFAQPEQFATTGMVAKNLVVAQQGQMGRKPLAVAFYEENLHSTEGGPTQATLDAVAPSAGAGVAMASEMLQAMRAGVRTQAMFSLAGYRFKRKDGLTVPLWGAVVDMGVTNRRRPQFLAGALLNTALRGAMTATAQTGGNPTWDEASGIDGVTMSGAHEIQSFAFREGRQRSLVLINLSRDAELAVDFTGATVPHGRVEMRQMRAAKITDSNEDAETVRIIPAVVQDFRAGQKLKLAGYSVTVMSWSE